MGKEIQKPNSSIQEETLNTYSHPEKQCKWRSYRTKLDRRTSLKVCVLTQSVLLGILSLSLLVAVTVLGVRPPFSEPEFSHVCPDNWPGFQGKCYYFSEPEGNWTTGRERCEALGASLATISTRAELVRTGMNCRTPESQVGFSQPWSDVGVSVGLAVQHKKAKGLDEKELNLPLPDASLSGISDGERVKFRASRARRPGRLLKKEARRQSRKVSWKGLHKAWFEVRGGGPCGYLNYGWISSSLCHTEKNWICSRPNDYVLWKGKLRDPKTGVSP
ncbi:uncharacterized protein LOC108642441 [Manacus vitellinus]|uniref:uncharacterized protein LOC108642441 n=1 Tax=Manacus vitellinus TaxID=328815 RepID=UPI00115C9651|nr:uncharacterized protein LOC108642441 [Manacus vitellinus]